MKKFIICLLLAVAFMGTKAQATLNVVDNGSSITYTTGSTQVTASKTQVILEKPATPTSLVYLHIGATKYGLNYKYYTPAKTNATQVYDTIASMLTSQDTSYSAVYYKITTAGVDTIDIPKNLYNFLTFRVDTGTVSILVDNTATTGIVTGSGTFGNHAAILGNRYRFALGNNTKVYVGAEKH